MYWYPRTLFTAEQATGALLFDNRHLFQKHVRLQQQMFVDGYVALYILLKTPTRRGTQIHFGKITEFRLELSS